MLYEFPSVLGFCIARGNNFSSSPASSAKSAVAAELRGCMTMSHPGSISRRCNLRISRRRRRIRLRRTALPSAFLMLQPNRLFSRPLGRMNIVNSRLDRRRPSRYTASYSPRRTSRAARGIFKPGASDARETVPPLLAPLRKHLPSALALHSSAKAVLLMPAAHMRLKCSLRQRSLSSVRKSWVIRRRLLASPARAIGLHRCVQVFGVSHASEMNPAPD